MSEAKGDKGQGPSNPSGFDEQTQNKFEFKYVQKQKFDQIVEKIKKEKKKSVIEDDERPLKSPERAYVSSLKVKLSDETPISPRSRSKSPEKFDQDKSLQDLIEKAKRKLKQKDESWKAAASPREKKFDSPIGTIKKLKEKTATKITPGEDNFPRSRPLQLDAQMRNNLKEMEEIEMFHMTMLKESKAEICFNPIDESPETLLDHDEIQITTKSVSQETVKIVEAKWVKILPNEGTAAAEAPEFNPISSTPVPPPALVPESFGEDGFLGSCEPLMSQKYPDYQQIQLKSQELKTAPQFVPTTTPVESLPQPFNSSYNPTLDYNITSHYGCGEIYPQEQQEEHQHQYPEHLQYQTIPDQPQNYADHSDLEYELQKRPDYTMHCYPRPKMDVNDTSEEGGKAEFISMENQTNSVNLCYLMNKAPMHFTDYSDDVSEIPTKDNQKMKIIFKKNTANGEKPTQPDAAKETNCPATQVATKTNAKAQNTQDLRNSDQTAQILQDMQNAEDTILEMGQESTPPEKAPRKKSKKSARSTKSIDDEDEDGLNTNASSNRSDEEQREFRKLKHLLELKELRDRRERREHRDRDHKEYKNAKEHKEPKDQKDHEETKEYKKLKGRREPKEIQNLKELKDLKDLRDLKELDEHMEINDTRDHNNLRDLKEFRDLKTFNDLKVLRDRKELQEHGEQEKERRKSKERRDQDKVKEAKEIRSRSAKRYKKRPDNPSHQETETKRHELQAKSPKNVGLKKEREFSPLKKHATPIPVIEFNDTEIFRRERVPRNTLPARSPRKTDKSPKASPHKKDKAKEPNISESLKLEKQKVFTKISNIQEVVIEILDKLKMSLVELHTLDINPHSKNYKNTLEFAVQFTRNYLLPLKTMIEDIRLTPDKSYTQIKSNAPCNRIIAVYKLIIQAVTTYQKHVRYFCVESIPNKLVSLLEHLHDITTLTIQKGLFNKDNIVIDCLMQRCLKFVDFINEKIEERMISARGKNKSPTRSIQSHYFTKKPKTDNLEMYDPKEPTTSRSKRSKWLMLAKDRPQGSKTDIIEQKKLHPEIDPEEDAVPFDDGVETQVGATRKANSGRDTLAVLNNLLLSASCNLLSDRKITEVTSDAINMALVEALQHTTKTQVVRLLEPYLQVLDSAVLRKC